MNIEKAKKYNIDNVKHLWCHLVDAQWRQRDCNFGGGDTVEVQRLKGSSSSGMESVGCSFGFKISQMRMQICSAMKINASDYSYCNST